MLAEFKYGLEPKETFARYLGDQAKPRRYITSVIQLLYLPLTAIPGSTITSRRAFSRSFTGIICCKVNGSDLRASFALTTCEDGSLTSNTWTNQACLRVFVV